MNFWLSHPRTGKKDTMLTLAVIGFMFCIAFTTGALITALATGDPEFLSSIAMIDGALLGPSLAAYATRKHSDNKFHRLHNTNNEEGERSV